MNKNEHIIYVNFSPYENAGNILDYFLENFSLVAVFSFSFHRLKNKKDTNQLKIFRKGKLIESKSLFDYQYPEKLIFLFLPLRSSYIFLQIILYSIYLNLKYGSFNYYFTVNAFTAWVGNILKSLRLTKKTIFWVYDYYPPFHESKTIAFMRWIYWQFDKHSTRSDLLVFLNKKIANLRHEIGELDTTIKYKIIPIGTSGIFIKKPKKLNRYSKISLVFLGVVKKSMGLDLILDNSERILKQFPNLELHIIGDGPELDYFKNKSKLTKIKVFFHGYLDDNKRDQILTICDIGLATYVPGKDNVSYYGDPSKIKQYLSYGLPVITTNVFDFSSEISKVEAGIIINYHKPNTLLNAITKIINNYNFYNKNASKLAKSYFYKNLYKQFFTN